MAEYTVVTITRMSVYGPEAHGFNFREAADVVDGAPERPGLTVGQTERWVFNTGHLDTDIAVSERLEDLSGWAHKIDEGEEG